jgi:hypothetical protein
MLAAAAACWLLAAPVGCTARSKLCKSNATSTTKPASEFAATRRSPSCFSLKAILMEHLNADVIAAKIPPAAAATGSEQKVVKKRKVDELDPAGGTPEAAAAGVGSTAAAVKKQKPPAPRAVISAVAAKHVTMQGAQDLARAARITSAPKQLSEQAVSSKLTVWADSYIDVDEECELDEPGVGDGCESDGDGGCIHCGCSWSCGSDGRQADRFAGAKVRPSTEPRRRCHHLRSGRRPLNNQVRLPPSQTHHGKFSGFVTTKLTKSDLGGAKPSKRVSCPLPSCKATACFGSEGGDGSEAAFDAIGIGNVVVQAFDLGYACDGHDVRSGEHVEQWTCCTKGHVTGTVCVSTSHVGVLGWQIDNDGW